MRSDTAQLPGCQTGRRDRGVREGAGGPRSICLMPSIGVLTLELHLPESHSLKDNRHTVKGLKEPLRSRHNVAVAEIDYQDTWQRSLISAVTVSSDRIRAEQVLQAVERDAVDYADRTWST